MENELAASPDSPACPWRRLVLCAIPLLVLYAWFALAIGSEDAVKSYFDVFRASHPFFTEAMEEVSKQTNIIIYVIYGIVLIVAVKRRDKARVKFVASFLVGLAVSLAIMETLKYAIGRPRPGVEGEYKAFSRHRSHQSFPSGHVTQAAVLASTLALRFGRYAFSLLIGLVPAAVAFSRVFLGKHHPSDLLGGLLVGSVGAAVAWWVERRDFWSRITYFK